MQGWREEKKNYLPLVETESNTEESKWDAEKAAYLWPMAPPKNDDILHDDTMTICP